MDKETLADTFEALAKKLRKDSCRLDSFKSNVSAGYESTDGLDGWVHHKSDGTRYFDISFCVYDKEDDKTEELAKD